MMEIYLLLSYIRLLNIYIYVYDKTLFRNCRMALRYACQFAPAGRPRDQCIRNIDDQDICPRFFCFCKEGWFRDQNTGIKVH